MEQQCFSSLKNQKKLLLQNSAKFCKHLIKMETQKIVNLLNSPENEYSKFATKKWYVIDNESKGSYSDHDPIRLLTKSIESNLCDYSDAYILVTGDIAATITIAVPSGSPQRKQVLTAATQVAFQNCAPFKKHTNCRT